MGTSLAIGVTGNIGSGKSEACRIFASLGGTVISADPLAKQLLETDERVRRSVNALFEQPVYREDGTLDRKMMARMIFSDDAAREKIEAIVHPRVIRTISDEIKRRKEQGIAGLLFVESALIFETGITDMFDYVVVVATDVSAANQRIAARDKMSEQDIALRRRSQIPDEKKSEQADFTIFNNGTLQDLENRCRFIYRLLASMSAT